MSTQALVTHPPEDGKSKFSLETLTIQPHLQPEDVLVRIIASGVCHTDLVFAQEPAYSPHFPRILGHEGAGYVEAVGSAVKSTKVGDAVLLSFSFCRSCRDCETGHPAYCESFNTVNCPGDERIFTWTEDGVKKQVSGLFFGQSSFANRTIVRETSVVNVQGLVRSEDELKLFAPMGCGFQTGMGTVNNLAGTGRQDKVVVLGLGGVGLAAIAAAKIAGAQTIIGVDRVEERLQLAKEFGATNVVNTSEIGTVLIDKIKEFTNGEGSSVTIDTTGNLGLIKDGLEITGKRGQMILLGVAPLSSELSVHLGAFMESGKLFRGSIEGDVIPCQYIPKMIKWYRDGQFEIEKLVKFFKVEDYDTAFEEMKSGKTIKPVLVW